MTDYLLWILDTVRLTEVPPNHISAILRCTHCHESPSAAPALARCTHNSLLATSDARRQNTIDIQEMGRDMGGPCERLRWHLCPVGVQSSLCRNLICQRNLGIGVLCVSGNVVMEPGAGGFAGGRSASETGKTGVSWYGDVRCLWGMSEGGGWGFGRGGEEVPGGGKCKCLEL